MAILKVSGVMRKAFPQVTQIKGLAVQRCTK
jgi:hypothetical protein